MVDFLLSPFDLAYMQRGLTELVMLSMIGVACGVHIVLRRLAFLTETLQHTIFPGIVIAFVAGQSLLLGALCAALLTVFLFSFAGRRPGFDQDSVLAVLVTTFFALGVVLVSRGDSYQHDLTVLLFGRVLAVDNAQIVQTVVVGIVVTVALTLLHKELILRASTREMPDDG